MDNAKETLAKQGITKTGLLGIQHVLAMFGATVLVPILTGLNPSIALLSAGVGTLIFHLVTKGKVPVFLGSSFAFIAALQAVIGNDPSTAAANTPKAMGGIIAAGCMYLLFSLLVKIFGVEKVRSFFPPVVTGPIIIVIGLSLAPGVVQGNILSDKVGGLLWQRLLVAAVVVLTMLGVGVFARGFFKLVPILFGIIAGYIAAYFFGFVSFTAVQEATWFIDFSQYKLPVFDLSSILIIAPVAIVTFIEHIGDITTNSAVVGKDFLTDPGLHRTLMGDGLATMMAGFLGGPPNTTYGENTGVLAVTKNYNPFNIRVAACVAIILGVFGKFGALIRTIPSPVMGGVSIILFGMIASIGIRILGENKVDLSENRNLFITSVLLVVGTTISFQVGSVVISGLSIAAVLGIILNKVLPEKKVKKATK